MTEKSPLGLQFVIRSDVIAGLSVAGLMLPEAVAYAGIAGLSPEHAILAGIAGCLIYAVSGQSRFAILSPTSSSAAILAATLTTLPQAEGTRVIITVIAVAMVGTLFLIASILRLGALTSFISHPVLRGFALGLALTIVIKQFPIMAGIHAPAGNVFETSWTMLRDFPRWHWPSLVVGATALCALIGLRRFPGIPGAALVLLTGISASALLNLESFGVALVGRITFDLSLPSISSVSSETLSSIAQLAIPLALILLAESWGTTRALALRRGDALEANRELRALGLANLGAALVQGMPVGAGLSATSANEAAGARTRLAGVVAAAALGLFVLAAMPLIARLPQPVLAAVVIAALTHALDPRPLARLWVLDRDQIVAPLAAVAVLFLGVLNGMLLAIVLSLAVLIRRFSTVRLLHLGQLGDSHDYVDLVRHPEARALPGIAIWRPAAPLFFANAEPILETILDEARREKARCAAIISLEESVDLDSTAFDALVAFDTQMTDLGFAPRYARVHDAVRDLLATGGAPAIVARSHYSVADAVAAIRRDK